MYRLRLKWKDLPKRHLDNLLLMYQYFTTERDVVKFKYIKDDIINNHLFLNDDMKRNPEVYFFIWKKNQKIFKNIAIENDKEYLKYLDKEDYKNPEIARKISSELNRFGESLNCITEENLTTLLEGKYGEKIEKELFN